MGPSSRSLVTKWAVAPMSFHAARVRLPVRVGALEAGQEGVVDVDDAPRESLAQFGGEDLHVAGEYDQFDVVLLDGIHHAVFEGELLAGGCHGVRFERHAVELGQAGEVVVVAEHERHVHGQLAGALAEEQVVEAVRRLGDEYERAQRAPDDVEVPGHVVAGDDGGEGGFELFATRGRFDLQSHEEVFGVEARELLRFGDVSAGFDDRPADGVHDAGAVVADDREHPVGAVGGGCGERVHENTLLVARGGTAHDAAPHGWLRGRPAAVGGDGDAVDVDGIVAEQPGDGCGEGVGFGRIRHDRHACAHAFFAER